MPNLFPDTVPTGYPADFNVAAQSLARRRALADALLARGFAAPQPQPVGPGQLAVPISPLQGLSGLVNTYFGAKGQKQVDLGEQTLAQQYRGEEADQIKRLLAPTADNPNADIPVATLISGMSSAHPGVASVSRALYEQQMKKRILPEHIITMPGTDATSRVEAAQTGDLSRIRPEQKVLSIGDQAVNVTPGQQPTSLGNFGPQYEMNPDGTTRIIQIAGADKQPEPYIRESKSGKLVKLDQAPKVNITNIPENKFGLVNAEQQGKLIGEALKSSREAATAARGDLQILSNAADAYNRGISTGSFQGARTEVAKLAETLGIKSPDPKVSNTDFFMKQMSTRILQHTKDLRPLSDTDRKFLEEILAGKNLTDDSLRRVIEIGMAQGEGAIQSHNELVGKHGALPGSIPGFADVYGVQPPQGLIRLKPGPAPTGKLRPYGGQ